MTEEEARAVLRVTRWIGGMPRITDADATEALTLLYRSAQRTLTGEEGSAPEPGASIDVLVRRMLTAVPVDVGRNGTPCAFMRAVDERAAS